MTHRLATSRLAALSALAALTAWPAASALAMEPEVADALSGLQSRWAEIRYDLPENQQEDAYAALAERAEQAVAAHPDAAELHAWAGIVRSTQAGASGGLSALSLVKQAREELEASLSLDPLALDGAAYTSLGALYYQVPGWPVSFGDDEKAERYLKRGLGVSPDGLDSLYFWGDYLHEQGRDQEARQALRHALEAAPRPGRERADAGRRQEVQALLEQLDH
ncbi:hypothetical protein [Halomonas organivorans]|uniref:Tetratricopeptide (TPR) repeat protein n=1 Tax=Halomonas organivorans TaxID=257772 RepID=A0A7W5BWJ9_9GAMM|nr:hypothetical protein [Halomonas organivorans]MBB3140470.1 tetratricopeptide (TPR) repeat protein [Halomonas organivorans]